MNERDDWNTPGLWGQGEQERTDWVTRTPGLTERVPAPREPLKPPLPASLQQEPAPLDLSDERTDRMVRQLAPARATPVSRPPVQPPRPPAPPPRRSGRRAKQQRMAMVGVVVGVGTTFCLGATLLIGVFVYSQQAGSTSIGLVPTAPSIPGTAGLMAAGTAPSAAGAPVDAPVEAPVATVVAPQPAAPVARRPEVVAAAPEPEPEPEPEPTPTPVAAAPPRDVPMVPTEPAWEGLAGDYVDTHSGFDLLGDGDDGMDGLVQTLGTDEEKDAWLEEASDDDPALAMLAEIDAPTPVATVSVRIVLEAGVPVAVDGRSVGVTPVALDLTPGWHAVTLGTGEAEAKFRLQAGSSSTTWCFESKGKSYREATCGA